MPSNFQTPASNCGNVTQCRAETRRKHCVLEKTILVGKPKRCVSCTGAILIRSMCFFFSIQPCCAGESLIAVLYHCELWANFPPVRWPQLSGIEHACTVVYVLSSTNTHSRVCESYCGGKTHRTLIGTRGEIFHVRDSPRFGLILRSRMRSYSRFPAINQYQPTCAVLKMAIEVHQIFPGKNYTTR